MSTVQKILVGILCVFIIGMFANSYGVNLGEQPTATERYEKMIKQDIREIYEGISNYKIIDIEEFKGGSSKFALVKVKYKGDDDYLYELVNFGDKTREVLPIPSGSAIEEIRNENYLRFVSYKEPPSNINTFPYIAECIRISNEDPLGKEKGNFIVIKEDIYVDIKQTAEYGTDNGNTSEIMNIIPTLNGIQILYKYDTGDSSHCPETMVDYDNEKNRLEIEIKNCKINYDNIIEKEIAVKTSPYIDSIKVEKNDDNCIIAVGIKNDLLQYTVKTGTLDNNSPYSVLVFKNDK
ncbi:MAG TPA: hypothetical protein GX526_02600 [Thermoanaerobacterales bacterium]|nr:hypothetical protein [Thermoanaerobacterales bacterium]